MEEIFLNPLSIHLFMERNIGNNLYCCNYFALVWHRFEIFLGLQGETFIQDIIKKTTYKNVFEWKIRLIVTKKMATPFGRIISSLCVMWFDDNFPFEPRFIFF